MIDFRSDTVTRPAPAMLDAMMNAAVGDDVFGEDPTVNQLETVSAGLFGMEAAIFCPSGTMTNQIAIKCHTQPGDEVICEKLSHVYQYEGGGIAFNSGASVRLLDGDRGRITAAQVNEAINPDDVHRPVTTLVSLENTANRGGGSCYDFAEIEAIKAVCLQHNLKLHLDGARLFNALVAKNENARQYGKVFDTISICLSKGLGTPVGSLLIGPQALSKRPAGSGKYLAAVCARQVLWRQPACTRLSIISAGWQKIINMPAYWQKPCKPGILWARSFPWKPISSFLK
jgi:threonine aldolase